MIKTNLALSARVFNKYEVYGGSSKYKMLPKDPYVKPYGGFTLMCGERFIMDMDARKLIICGKEFEGAKNNGSYEDDIAYAFYSGDIEIVIKHLPPFQLMFCPTYILGFINGRKLFLARSRSEKNIKYSGSSQINNMFGCGDAAMAMAYLCVYVFYLIPSVD